MKTKLLFTLLLIISATAAFAQKIITGQISDSKGIPVIGATVLEKGTTNGTITDFDGNYSLEVASTTSILQYSYIGYVTQEINVGNNTVINVTLVEDTQALEEVVVTALGIKRDKKALGYAVSNVEGGNLSAFSKVNPIEGLSGQVAGLNISTSGSGAGGSAKVTIRGVSSLTGSNEPLYVVDGVPMDNTGGVDGGADGTGMYGGTDYGNAANNINADDIESISVLKGGAAAALYGSRGQNGVIMITTKKGSKNEDRVGIKYGYQIQVSTPSIKPEFQNSYSQGSAGKFNPTDYQSWGKKMDNSEITNFLGQTQLLSPINEHPYDTYFQTGISHNHNVSVSNRTDKMGVYFSLTNTNDNGIVPGNEIKKNSLTLRFDTKLGKYITLDAKANYIDQKANNRPNLGGSPDNPVYALWYMPRSVDLRSLQSYQTNSGIPVIWTEQYSTMDGSIIAPENITYAKSPLLNNPYWTENLNTNYDKRKRIIGFVEMNFDIAKMFNLPFNLNFKARGGIDYYNDERQRQVANNTYYKKSGLATLSLINSSFSEENYDFLLNGSHRFGKFGLNASVGGNLMRRNIYSTNSSSESGMINKEGYYVLQNFNNLVSTQGIAESEIQSLYAFVSMDWDSQFFLDITARNDWTSVLSPKNWSIFYPSVSGSWIISETFDLGDDVDMLKLRGSWAAVGSGGNYSSSRYNVYGTSANQFHGLPYGFIPSSRVNPDLRSEYTISSEVGANLIMWQNRFNLDLSYYTNGTKDQIFTAPLAPSSGYAKGIINAGYIKNSGIEMQVKGSVLRNKNLDWWIGANVSYQWNEVMDLPDEVPVLTLGGADGLTINALNDKPVGAMMGTAFNRDENGNIILDDNNLPTIKQNDAGANDVMQELGKIYPDWLLGFSTGLSYKGFNVNILIDGKLGHNIYSRSNRVGSELGVLANTVAGRDEWETAKVIGQETGIMPNMGYMVKGVKNGTLGEYAVDPQLYWQRVATVNEMWVYDASYIRLRQISLGYNITPKMHKIKFLDNIGLTANVNNICYLMKKTPNISPEAYVTTGNAAGIEIFGMPETLQFTFGVNVSF